MRPWPGNTRCLLIWSNAWLMASEIFPEATGFMTAIQDQVVGTGNSKKWVWKDPNLLTISAGNVEINWKQFNVFRVLAQGSYTHRHSQVANIVPVKRRLSEEPQMLVITVRHNPCYRTPNTYKLYHDRCIVTDWQLSMTRDRTWVFLTAPSKKHI